MQSSRCPAAPLARRDDPRPDPGGAAGRTRVRQYQYACRL